MALTKIKTDGITNDAVTNAKIADDAIDTPQIADGAVDTVNIADLNVDTGKITGDAITGAKIADDAVDSEHLANGCINNSNFFQGTIVNSAALSSNAVTTAKITDEAVTLAKLEHGTSSNDGKFLRANNGADPTFETLPASGKATNLFSNGAMTIAQRGISSSSNGYQTVDRMYVESYDTDETASQAQVDVASGTTPYTLGFRKALKITNGNQTSGAGNQDVLVTTQTIEAQDIANSGWDYTSTSSYITLSFWVKSSVAQNFYGRLYSYDGTPQGYAYETGSLSANTWTKVTKTIPGNSNLQFDNDTNYGLLFELAGFRGTGFTGSMSLNQWGAFNGNVRTPDQTTTWYTTNDATLEITGLLLEVGNTASDFPHLSYAENLAICQRYYWKIAQNTFRRVNGYKRHDGNSFWELQCPVPMRTTPSPTLLSSGTFTNFTSNFGTTQSGPNVNEWNQSTGWGLLYVSSTWSTTSASIPSWEGYSIEFSADF